MHEKSWKNLKSKNSENPERYPTYVDDDVDQKNAAREQSRLEKEAENQQAAEAKQRNAEKKKRIAAVKDRNKTDKVFYFSKATKCRKEETNCGSEGPK